MQAVRFVGVGRAAQIEDVPSPQPVLDRCSSRSAVLACATRICM